MISLSNSEWHLCSCKTAMADIIHVFFGFVMIPAVSWHRPTLSHHFLNYFCLYGYKQLVVWEIIQVVKKNIKCTWVLNILTSFLWSIRVQTVENCYRFVNCPVLFPAVLLPKRSLAKTRGCEAAGHEAVCKSSKPEWILKLCNIR